MIKASNIQYDLIMKFRADMEEAVLPPLTPAKEDAYHLDMVKPNCHFKGFGLHKVPVVSDCWVWGNFKSMELYCNTYFYVIDQLKKRKGYYLIHFESCVTDNVFSHNIPITFHSLHYRLAKDRRSLDPLERNTAPFLPKTALNKN